MTQFILIMLWIGGLFNSPQVTVIGTYSTAQECNRKVMASKELYPDHAYACVGMPK